MLFTWPARIVGHVGHLAVVQVPGGLLVADDPRGWLVDDTDAKVQASDPTHALVGVVFLETYQARQVGPVALLTSDRGARLALIVPESQVLPRAFTLSIPVRQTAQVDADENPNGLGDPPPNCCQDIDPAAIDALIPCCCPDVTPDAIDLLFAGAAAPLPSLRMQEDPFAFIATPADTRINLATAGPFITKTSMDELLGPVGAADPLAFLSE